MRRHTAGEDRDVVPPLEQADDSALGMGLGNCDDFLGDALEVLDLQPEVTHRILGMGVEPRADQDKFRFDPVGQAMQASPEGGQISSPRLCHRAGGYSRHVPSPGPVPVSSFAPVPG